MLTLATATAATADKAGADRLNLDVPASATSDKLLAFSRAPATAGGGTP